MVVLLSGIIMILFILVVILTLLLISERRKIKAQIQLYRKTLVSTLKTFTPQMEIIFSLFVSLKDIELSDLDDNLSEKIKKLLDDVSEVRSSIMSLTDFLDVLENEKEFDDKTIDLLGHQINIVNHVLYSSSVNIIMTVGEFSTLFKKNKALLFESNHMMASIIYYLSKITPILSEFTKTSNSVSQEVIMEMIGKFNQITDFSAKITHDIKSTMNDLMDKTRQDSLAYVVIKAENVLDEFKGFFGDMEKLKDSSSHFIQESVDKLTGISDIASSIEDIAETIKVISLNVSIEAANTGSAAKGFQVLARDLREFALKTRTFAGDVKIRVKEAIVTTDDLKSDYIENMNEVFGYVSELKNSLETFKSIINQSFDKIQTVIGSLQKFSNQIDKGIKNVVGQLQFYDVRSQEIEHLSLFVENALKKFYSDMDKIQINAILTGDEKAEVKKEILIKMDKFITTANERKLLEKYENDFGIKVSQSSIFGESKPDDTIIVF